MHRKVAAALLAVLALGVTSCGSSGRTVSQAELVRQVELACKEAQREVQSTARRGSGEATVRFVAAVIAGQRLLIARIKQYDGSGEAKAEFADFKQTMQQRLALLERVRSVRSGQLRNAIRGAQAEAEALSTRARAIAARIGFQGCG